MPATYNDIGTRGVATCSIKSEMKIDAFKKQWLFVIVIGCATAVTVFLYELVKEVVKPDITIWESHAVTIAFCTITASIAAYFLFGKHSKGASAKVTLSG